MAKNLPVCEGGAGDPGDTCLIPGLGRFPGEENGNPLQYSCLENSMDKGTCWTTVHTVAKSRIRLSTHTHICSMHVLPNPSVCYPS